MNTILASDYIPWKMENCEIVRAFNPQIQAQIREASILLTNPRFNGPDEQYKKAIAHLNRRPEPDNENCVKDAIGALEATANIIAGTSQQQLNTLLERNPYASNIHITIRQSIDKVYAYRGAAPGVAHGQVGTSVVGISEASWVLAVSAATIIYLVSKFTIEQE